MPTPTRASSIALLLLALPTASLVVAPPPSLSRPAARIVGAAPRSTLGCTGAITLAAGVDIVGAFAGTSVSETVDVGVRCDGADVVRVRHLEGSGIGSCRRPVPANLDRPWQPLVGSAFTVTLYIPGNFVDQTVWAQFQTASGTISPVFCDDIVSEGMPPQPTWDPRTPTADGRTTPVWIPTRDPRTPTETATVTDAPIPTGTPSPTRTYGPSPTPSPGPTSTPRTAAVHGRILLAGGAATISGALGSAIDVPLTLDLTGEGAPLCLMRLRLSGVGCREDADGGLAGQPWQAFRRVVSLEVPLAQHGVTISAWAQVATAGGEVSRAFCDDVRVHAPHTATPCGGSPTPRVSTPLPPVTPCPRWHSPVYLPAAFDGAPRSTPALPRRQF